MLSSLKLGCLGRQSALWWRSFGLPNHSRLPSGSLCLGGRGTPLTPPSSSLSRERSLPRKEHTIRGSAPAHPAPTTVWGVRGWPFPHQRPRRWVDLKLPDKPVASVRLSPSWPSGRDEESFHGHLRRQGQTVQTFLPASNTLSLLRSATPTQQVLVYNKQPSSIYLRVAVGDASGFLPLQPGPLSPAAHMIEDTFGFLPQPTDPVPATLHSMNKDAKDIPLWWTTSSSFLGLVSSPWGSNGSPIWVFGVSSRTGSDY